MFYERLYDYTKKICKINPDTTLYYQEKYLQPASDTSLFRGLGLCYLLKGIVEKDLGYYDKAIQSNKQALIYLKPINFQVGVAAIYNNLGTVYKRKALYKKALEVYLKSLKLKKQFNDDKKLTYSYNNIGLLYDKLGKYEEAEKIYKKSVKICKKHGLHNKLAKNYNNLGNVKIEINKPDIAKKYYKLSLEYLEPGKNLLLRSTILSNIGISYEKLNHPDSAFFYYEKALGLSKKTGDAQTILNSLRHIGRLKTSTGHYEKAKYYLNKAYEKARKKGSHKSLMDISKLLYFLYKSQDKFPKSLIYLEKHLAFKDSVMNIEKAKEIERLEAQYKAKQREQQIVLLEKQNKVKELELAKEREQKARKQLQAIVLFGIAGMAIVLAIFLAFQNKRKKQINKLLHNQYTKIGEQQEEIKTQNQKLLKSNEMKDQMFRIIAHDLRSPLIAMDDVARLIPYAIEEKDFDSLNDLSASLQNSVSRILDLTDNLLSWSMSQSDEISYKPENLSLYETAKKTLEIYFALARMKQINLMNNIDTGIYVYADKNILMTVLRNLINNALKFTKEEGMVSLGAHSDNDKVVVWVRDTGIGMDEDKIQNIFDLEKTRSAGTNGETGNGLGLFFCKKFVQVNKGEIDVRSEKGKGTIVYFTLPKAESMVYG
jgi:signal transduction histidine kinase